MNKTARGNHIILTPIEMYHTRKRELNAMDSSVLGIYPSYKLHEYLYLR